MSRTSTPHSRVQRLASLIEQDVRRRGLSLGDPYLTAAEAGKDFGTDPFTATRAMSLLAKRGVLIRKRGVGTFVGDNAHESPLAALRSVHVLVHESRGWGFPVGQLVQGLHEVLPSLQVHSTIVPDGNAAAVVRAVIERQTADGLLAGMVLQGCVRSIQRLVLDYHVPAVSFGGVYSDTSELPSVDVDQFEVGRLAAEHLLRQGHRRIVLLMRNIWRPGDNRLVAGVDRAMADAGASYGALVTRSVAEDAALVKNEVERLLASKDRPTGLICRCSRFAEIALDVLTARGQRVPEDLDIVFNYHDRTKVDSLGLPCISPELSCKAQAASVVGTLKRIIEEKELKAEHAILPVRLFEPANQRKSSQR